MENNNQYLIVDEPRLKSWSKFIVNPVVILFAAMLIPMFWTPPFFGRFWLPFLWLFVNGLMLGSPTLKKETVYIIFGLVIMGVIFYAMFYIIGNNIQFQFSMLKYMGVLLNAVMFFFMYMVVFLQMQPFEIYEYSKGDQ